MEPRAKLRCLAITLGFSALLIALPTTAHGQWRRHKELPCPCEPCPAPAPVTPQQPETPQLPEATPPVVPLPEPTPEPMTSAALGGDQLSINMFGDRFGSSGVSKITISSPRSFTNYQVFDVSTGRLGFAPGNATQPAVYFQSVGGQTTTAFIVQTGQTFVLDNNQPFAPAGSQNIRNGQAVITQSAFETSGLANGTYTVLSQIVVNVPNPGSGGVVGRPRLSEDLNPMPRDRVIFNYDYFNQTQLAPNGQDVHRYVLGFEKTFFDQMASIEVRLPFASTMSSDIVVGNQATRTELGDLRLLLKGLLYTSETINVATGLGIYLPTAQDTDVSLGGTTLVHIDNKAVILTPYVGVLFTPTDRLFAQVWFSFDFDTNGCPVEVANSSFTGLQAAGRIQDQTLMQWDLQVGYWLRLPGQGNGMVRGFAPFGELHYGTTLNDADIVQSNGFVIGNLANRTDELNLAAGFAAQIWDNLLLTVGAAAPLRQNFDRGFDYQIGVRASLFFGPTAARRRAAYVSAF